MALIVEDGTGRADAESYISVADADTYHAARGATAWAGYSTSDKEAALRRATEYMVQFYRLRWAGYRYTSTQALDWPRAEVPIVDAPSGYGSFSAVYATNVVPVAVQRACAELALRSAGGTTLAPDVAAQKKRTKVGPIETEYADGARQSSYYQAVEMLLRPLFKTAGGDTITVVRA